MDFLMSGRAAALDATAALAAGLPSLKSWLPTPPTSARLSTALTQEPSGFEDSGAILVDLGRDPNSGTAHGPTPWAVLCPRR